MPEAKALYVSYNEKENGSFEDAVIISNVLGSVTWLHANRLVNLVTPTEVLIKISGGGENAGKCYRGHLVAVAQRADLGSDFRAGERNHRPRAWQQKDKEGKDFQTALFISGLRLDPNPPEEVVSGRAPQSAKYVLVDF